MISITADLALEEREIKEVFIHASGPGGQHVNKVATAVQLRFDIYRSPSLSEDIKKRLVSIAGKRVNKEGVLIIDARRYRNLEANRREALQRLTDLIRRAIYKPKPRKKTRPTTESKKKRIEAKRKRGLIKKTRQGISDYQDP